MAKSQARKGKLSKIEYIPDTDVVIPSDLPILTRGQKPGEEDMLKLATFVCEIYATNLYPLAACLKFAGIGSEGTWQKWVRENEAVEVLYLKAKRYKADNYRSRIHQLAITSLEKQITGFTVPFEEITETVQFIQDTDEEGKVIKNGAVYEMVSARTIKRKKLYIRPSTPAIIFALTNVDSTNFKRLPTEDDETNRETNIPLIDWVD